MFLWLILIFYLRPSESFRLTVGHFTPPLISRGSRLYRWSLVLHRFEDEVPSKVGAFDETLLLDLEEHQWFGRVLEKWLANSAPHEPLVNFTQRQNSQKTLEIAGEIDLDPKPTWYQIRHSVVSLDLALDQGKRPTGPGSQPATAHQRGPVGRKIQAAVADLAARRSQGPQPPPRFAYKQVKGCAPPSLLSVRIFIEVYAGSARLSKKMHARATTFWLGMYFMDLIMTLQSQKIKNLSVVGFFQRLLFVSMPVSRARLGPAYEGLVMAHRHCVTRSTFWGYQIWMIDTNSRLKWATSP